MSADWSLPSAVFDYLAPRIRGLYVLEFGSGKGSTRLASLCAELTSIEHDEKYATFYPPDAGQVIHAPIDPATGWYSRQVLEARMPKRIDAIVVDGPPGTIGRGGLLKHLDLIPDVPILFDDTHRGAERELAISYWKIRQKPSLALYALKDGRGFAAVGFEL